MKTSNLLPVTRLVLLVSALVQAIMALAGFFAPDFTRAVLSPSTQSPTIAIQYVAGFYLAGALGATYALRQNIWVAARTYLASALVLIASFTLVTIVGLLTPPGLQPVSWLYVLLSVVYLPIVAWVWHQETARVAADDHPAIAARV